MNDSEGRTLLLLVPEIEELIEVGESGGDGESVVGGGGGGEEN